jgi:hypothetical protein
VGAFTPISGRRVRLPVLCVTGGPILFLIRCRDC